MNYLAEYYKIRTWFFSNNLRNNESNINSYKLIKFLSNIFIFYRFLSFYCHLYIHTIQFFMNVIVTIYNINEILAKFYTQCLCGKMATVRRLPARTTRDILISLVFSVRAENCVLSSDLNQRISNFYEKIAFYTDYKKLCPVAFYVSNYTFGTFMFQF